MHRVGREFEETAPEVVGGVLGLSDNLLYLRPLVFSHIRDVQPLFAKGTRFVVGERGEIALGGGEVAAWVGAGVIHDWEFFGCVVFFFVGGERGEVRR